MSGPLPERIEVFPRTLIETPLPGSPLDCVTCTPATLPLNNCAGEGEATLSKSSAQFDQHQLHLSFNCTVTNHDYFL
jgi:hypothetical protein